MRQWYDSLWADLPNITSLPNGLGSHYRVGVTEAKSTQISVDIRLEIASVQRM